MKPEFEDLGDSESLDDFTRRLSAYQKALSEWKVANLGALLRPLSPVWKRTVETAEQRAARRVTSKANYRDRRRAKKGLLPIDIAKKARRKKSSDRAKAKACSNVPGIEYLAMDPCAYCGDPTPTTHDHIEPVYRGGSHELFNLVRACRKCNFEKGTQSLLVFLARRALRRIA